MTFIHVHVQCILLCMNDSIYNCFINHNEVFEHSLSWFQRNWRQRISAD